MKEAVVLLLLLLPTSVCAEGTSTTDFSFFSSFIQMIAALAIVIGLILLTRHFSARLLNVNSGGLASKHIRIIETRYLGPKKTLMLIEVGGEYLLLASSDEGITLLKQVELLEDIEVVEESGRLGSDMASLLKKIGIKRNG